MNQTRPQPRSHAPSLATLTVFLLGGAAACTNLDTHLKNGDYGGADRCCAARRGDARKACWIRIGEHHSRHKRYAEAVVAYGKAKREDLVRTAHYRQGKLFLAAGKGREALQSFRFAQDPAWERKAHALLAATALKEGRPAEAARHFLRAGDRQGAQRAMLPALKAFIGKKDFAGAARFFEAFGMRPREAVIRAAYLAMDMGQRPAVEAWLRNVKWPLRRIASLVARHAMERGRLRVAERTYVKSDAPPRLWGMLLARKWVVAGDTGQAYRVLTRTGYSPGAAARILAPLLEAQGRHVAAGRYYLKAGQSVEAMLSFRRALPSKNPRHVVQALHGLVLAGDPRIVGRLHEFEKHDSTAVRVAAKFLGVWKGKKGIYRTIFVDWGMKGRLDKAYLGLVRRMTRGGFDTLRGALKGLGSKAGRPKFHRVPRDEFYGVSPARFDLRPGVARVAGGLGTYDVVVLCHRDFDQQRRGTGHLLVGYPAIPIALKVMCTVYLPPLGVQRSFEFEVAHPQLVEKQQARLRARQAKETTTEYRRQILQLKKKISAFLTAYAR